MNIAADAASSAANNELLFVGFNQDQGCFACGTNNGFIIYNVDPFRETFRRVFPNGGIGIVEMLFRCNLLALVGGGRNPRYPTNKVMIWDDHQNKCIGELKFRTEVKAVRLRRDRVVVVLESKVFVYQFKDLKLLDQITTVSNPKGLVSLCSDPKTNILAVPGLTRGTIRVELYDISKATLIKAHDADLAQFSLNLDGSKLASASEKGTLIRIWNCHTGEPIRELRRGMDRAEIYCLAFNPLSTFLACSSDKGTVHIFSLTAPAPNAQASGAGGLPPPPGALEAGMSPPPAGRQWSANDVTPHTESLAKYSNKNNSVESYDTSTLANGASNPTDNNATNNKSMSGMGMFLKGILPTGLVPKYFESEWSFAQVRGIETKSICAFSKDSSKIIIVTADGQFIVANVEEGVCSRVSTSRYLKTPEELHNEDDINWGKISATGKV